MSTGMNEGELYRSALSSEHGMRWYNIMLWGNETSWGN